jgi:hypothetical protein
MRTGGIEHLPNKCEAPSTNSSNTKKKKKTTHEKETATRADIY